MLPRLLAFAGYARVGKDTIAAQFTSHERIAFADELKRRAAIALCTDVETINARKGELRDALVAIGAGARLLDPDVWVRPVEKQIVQYPRPWKVCDVRYVNESAMIQKHGGVVIWIDREGVTYANAEEARSMPPVRAMSNYIINNDADPAVVAARIRFLLRTAA